ncbi:MAG: hypothetical protein PHC30_02430 [Lentisphaeria bacterium]|nr:hypothetical protein [Lentisphaeria bacterium]
MSWVQLEKLAAAYRRKPTAATAAALDRGQRRAADFVETLTNHFVRNHTALETASVAFRESEDGTYPGWACEYNAEQQLFELNLVGVLEFHEECKQALAVMKTLEGRENFSVYRLHAFLAEMRKLPRKLLVFLLLFREKARVLEVTQAERRRGARVALDPDEDAYMRLLWAFKELEAVMRTLSGTDLRAELNITWFEADWIIGGK